MNKGIVIFDLDGTIANLEHRLHFITGETPKDWDSFFDHCDKDILNPWSQGMILALSDYGYRILIVSGRPERIRAKTEAWLKKYVVFHELHLVRTDDNHVSDDFLKEQWLKSFPRRNDIEFVVDDRQGVVDMWRRNGLVCLQCYAWKESE